MNKDSEKLASTVSMALVETERKTPSELRQLISAMNDMICGGRVEPDGQEHIARQIEENLGVSMGLGAVVDDGSFEPWLDEAKKKIEPFYWGRYKKLLIKNGLPQDVVTKLDQVTDTILGRLGNPQKESQWDRRGMVVGHVQSGKTANYAGLITKAADAGYRLIIVIAGIHNNLRNQTQQRIDEGFIGRDTGHINLGRQASKVIGVGAFGDTRIPVSLTTAHSDFNKTLATNNKSQIESYNVPVVLVIKKNPNTLRNLIDWLKENSAKGDAEMIDQPMLLIDDEADNASINTKYGSKLNGGSSEITRINGQIRELLKVFHRSCYVGYTATPFANIFIDPDSEDEMYGEDLYPKHFIVGLDAPSNYFGSKKVFVDGLPDVGKPNYLRFIDDNEDILPIIHKIDHELTELPKSLLYALRTFLIARTIRNLRGQQSKHASMLVNASRFTRVQGVIRNRLHEKLDSIQNALRVNGAMGERGISDPEISALKEVWISEFGDTEFGWPKVQKAMLDAVAAAKVVEVNSSKNDLDYASDGQTIIAVGGYSLSRGLTLEGLTVTWFLRNTKMYDTLMQMGRWFGYRLNYEDLCRIWMPTDAISWYSHIAQATEELHEKLREMEMAKANPMQFGLAVRSHPSSLMVTARNKLGSGEKTVSVGLSSQFVETARLSVDRKSLEQNKLAAATLLKNLTAAGYGMDTAEVASGGKLLRAVRVEHIDAFLRAWVNAEQSITTQIDPLRKYIADRAQDELADWDVFIGSLSKGTETDSLGWPIIPMQRKIEPRDLHQGFLSIGGRKMRVSTRAVERVGLSPEQATAAETKYRSAENKEDGSEVNYPGYIYRRVRENPLLALYLVDVSQSANEANNVPENFPSEPVVAWAISFPTSKRPDERVEYIINTVRQKELFGTPDVDEEMETTDG